jgi:hypothetical protein
MGFAAGVCLSEAPPLLGFCLGWSSNFVGSESGQILQSVELLHNMVCNRPQHPPQPPSHTYILYFEQGKGGGGGEVNQADRKRGNNLQSWVKSPFRVNFLR